MEGEEKPVNGRDVAPKKQQHGSEGMSEIPCSEKTTHSSGEVVEKDLHQTPHCENGGGPSLPEIPGLPQELHPDEGHVVKDEPASANKECDGYNKDDAEPGNASVLTGNSQDIDVTKHPDSNDGHQHGEHEAHVPERRYDSFIQEILGCLDELRSTDNDLHGENSDRSLGVQPNEGNETKATELAGFASSAVDKKSPSGGDEAYPEPALVGTIPSEINNESISCSVDLHRETCLENGAQEALTLNNFNSSAHSYLTSETGGKFNIFSRDGSLSNDTKGAPADQNGHIYPMNIELCAVQSEARHSTLPVKGDVCDTVILLPIPENLREHSWLFVNTRALKLGTSGFSYIGGIADGKMSGFGRLMLGGDGQFIEGIWHMNHLVSLFFCQLICHPGKQTALIFKRQNDYLLSMYECNYVARVNFDAIEELDLTDSVAHFKLLLFRKLRVLEIMVDELEPKKLASSNQFAVLLEKTVDLDADPIVRADTLILLSQYLQKPDTEVSNFFRDRRIPVSLRDAAAGLLECENQYLNNTYMFLNKVAKLRLELRKVLTKIYNDRIARYRQMLIEKCPTALPGLIKFIKSAPECKIVYITSEDMRVFDHLVSQPCFEYYKDYFMQLAERFCRTIHNLETHATPSTIIPIISPVYGFIVKSFWEVVSEIIQVVASYDYKDMLYCESGRWRLQEYIKWPKSETSDSQKVLEFFKSSENKSSLYHSALEVQYKFIYKMMIFFSPDNYVTKRKFEQNFHVLEKNLSWWEKGLKMVKQTVGLAKRLEHWTPERTVWLYLLDHTIHEVFKDDPKCQILLKPYSALLEGQISHIERSPTESHETFRVMTHSIVKFITSTAPYFKEAEENPGIDVEILVQQIWTFSTASQEIEKDPTTISSFRDLIAEYNRYLSLRLFINIESTSGHFSPQITQMMQTFMRIVVTSLKKTVPTTTLVGYLRSLNDFLDDFKNIDFLSNWFVKSKFFDAEILEKVYNKLSSGGNCSYRVINIEKFVQVVHILGNHPIPSHYIIQVVSQSLECIELCLDKQWQSGNVELQITQLECTSLLLDAVRRSFMYLKEQPDYVDFEIFEKESVDPFVRLVNDCVTLSDLKLRTACVAESFWFIRKMDEIGIDQALKMFKNINTCPVPNKLLDCYNVYLSNYNEHITKYNSLLLDGKSHAESLEEVAQVLDKTKTMHFSMWTAEFKTTELPVLLAGLSAVWSILVSKDISRTGKFLKPHCIQILCVLRLLSVDQSKGAENHLAQVLTGQGKSVILGLLSSVLALTGHKVKVLCYSKYLSDRDQNDFERFFKTFQVNDKVVYATFEEMANGFLNPISNGVQSPIRQLVQDKVLNHTNLPTTTTTTTSISKDTVLLIDEVDVFFTDRFFGNSYFPVTCPGFDGLAKVQQKIWFLSAKSNEEEIVQRTNNYIANLVASGDKEMLEFNVFLNQPGTFTLLRSEKNSKCSIATYTNRSLFDEHLLQMATDAIHVRDTEWARSGYKMTPEGIISLRDSDGLYLNGLMSGYRNIFNYFRLKRSKFDSKNFRNYGYFNLKVGQISYARLPSQFQLILGVSGTLTNLSGHENSAMKFYNINKFSILPSFFGDSNLLFNAEDDFHYFNKEQDWLKEIYDRANGIVESRRAILIFFDLDTTIDIFTNEYKNKFDRLHYMTENTCASIRDKYISEAGLPCTVTLATRGMGRGVDYKSSWSVEKNGGVHVIQTFYAIDVKEENQIKGRTARKDNKGSYELIICREHLVKNEIISEDDHNNYSYQRLDRIRKDLSNKKGETLNAEIEQCEFNHTTTMKYFGLI